eukprot:TRINITY_DN29818_c0_g1_i1.p1 TRINITY_DN29818_c0_g1~~TRINITY_DN29818_c0_g1_i1.p1  ORF type:complete len:332 (+),score=31.47 TRINITY_DN29818_c0_g1_i1:52-996(+)
MVGGITLRQVGDPSSAVNGSEVFGCSAAKRLVIFLHFHGSGGTSLCNFARRAWQAGNTGVYLVPEQNEFYANCNMNGWSPYSWFMGVQPDLRLSTCRGLLSHARERGWTWAHVETAMDVKPPCRGVVFLTVVREPWQRMLTELLTPRHVLEALALLRGMRRGDTLENSSRLIGSYGFANRGEPVLGALYFDNYHVRVLLGSGPGVKLPWGCVGVAQLELATSTLEAFSLVVPLPALDGALSVLQRTIGRAFRLDDPGLHWGRHANTRRAARLDNVPGLRALERLFRARNGPDARLYSWAVDRWFHDESFAVRHE